MAEKRHFSSFFVDDLFLGIDVEQVQEVTSGADLTPVPLSSPLVRGLLNLRGHIVTAIDLRRCLRLADRRTEQPPVNVILQTADGCVSLLVDRVGDVLDVDEHDFELTPATVRGRLRELIRGTYHVDGRLLLALDTDKVLNLVAVDLEQSAAARSQEKEDNSSFGGLQ